MEFLPRHEVQIVRQIEVWQTVYLRAESPEAARELARARFGPDSPALPHVAFREPGAAPRDVDVVGRVVRLDLVEPRPEPTPGEPS